MKATPFLFIEDNEVKGYGTISPKPIGSGDFWLVQFDGPGKRYGKILPTAELTRFTVFASQEDLTAFMAPPPAPPEVPSSVSSEEDEETAKQKNVNIIREELEKAKKALFERREKEIANPSQMLLDSPSKEVPTGN